MRRRLWLAAPAIALVALIALALTGRRPEPGLAPFEAAGVMVAIPPETVTSIDVSTDERHWRFERAGTGWRVMAPSRPAGDDFSARIDAGLRFLHASAPQRRLEASELEATTAEDFGLEPPRYVISIQAAGRGEFTVAFGATNPQGLAQYARVGADPGLVLLPRYVGEAWEAATGMP